MPQRARREAGCGGQPFDRELVQRIASRGHELSLGATAADEQDLTPSARSASATASAGTTCPAVPPAAITIRLGCAHGSIVAVPAHERRRTAGFAAPPPARWREGTDMSGTARGDVQEQSHAASITIKLLEP